MKISEESNGDDGDIVNFVNVEVSGEKSEANEVHSEISGVNSEIIDVNEMSSEVNSAKSDIILDWKNGDLRDDRVDQGVNSYINEFSDISSNDDFDDDAEIPDGLYVGHDIGDEDQISDDVISISSEDEVAVAIRDETLIVETFVMTVTRKTRIINGGVKDVNITVEKDYYRN